MSEANELMRNLELGLKYFGFETKKLGEEGRGVKLVFGSEGERGISMDCFSVAALPQLARFARSHLPSANSVFRRNTTPRSLGSLGDTPSPSSLHYSKSHYTDVSTLQRQSVLYTQP